METFSESAHELAAAIRGELRNSPPDASAILSEVQSASDLARSGLRTLFPNLLEELRLAKEAGHFTQAEYDAIMQAINA